MKPLTSQIELEITPEFRRALDLMERSSRNLFITGKAGTGKSTLLHLFRGQTAKKVVVLAPTGVAAINVHGQTIHSFCGFPPRPISASEIRRTLRGELCRHLDAVIIDEVSMVRADMMENIDVFFRRNARHGNRPFGGLQVILFGDPYQLPPVVASSEERRFLDEQYHSPFFFDARAYGRAGFQTLELTKTFRQTDPAFIAALNSIRTGSFVESHLSLLNQRCDPDFEPQHGDGFFLLSTTNDIADRKNNAMLAQLPGKEFAYQGQVTGQFDQRLFPTRQDLRLKEGAQVMFIKNDAQGRWVNGSVGWVRGLARRKIEVEVATYDNGPAPIYEVEREKWERVRYRFNREQGEIETEEIGAFKQYPLKLAWALTIHKSQGQTFARVVIDFGSGTFADGQAYVALSRCRSLDGIVLKRPIDPADIRVAPAVRRFFDLEV